MVPQRHKALVIGQQLGHIYINCSSSLCRGLAVVCITLYELLLNPRVIKKYDNDNDAPGPQLPSLTQRSKRTVASSGRIEENLMKTQRALCNHRYLRQCNMPMNLKNMSQIKAVVFLENPRARVLQMYDNGVLP